MTSTINHDAQRFRDGVKGVGGEFELAFCHMNRVDPGVREESRKVFSRSQSNPVIEFCIVRDHAKVPKSLALRVELCKNGCYIAGTGKHHGSDSGELSVIFGKFAFVWADEFGKERGIMHKAMLINQATADLGWNRRGIGVAHRLKINDEIRHFREYL